MKTKDLREKSVEELKALLDEQQQPIPSSYGESNWSVG